jgi:GntR family carbon starvation induced transcriptional regulator
MARSECRQESNIHAKDRNVRSFGAPMVLDADGSKLTLASETYARLRREIIDTTLPSGARLRLRELCETYGVGLSPMREALSKLAAEGLVLQADQRGFTVAPLELGALEELTHARCWVNEIGVRQSIAKATGAWEEQLLLSHHRMSQLRRVSTSNPNIRMPEWALRHADFHRVLVSGCGSRWLVDFCDRLFDAAERYRYVARQAGKSRRGVDDEHKAILEAALAHDSDLCVKRLNDHFWKTAELGMKALRSMQA